MPTSSFAAGRAAGADHAHRGGVRLTSRRRAASPRRICSGSRAGEIVANQWDGSARWCWGSVRRECAAVGWLACAAGLVATVLRLAAVRRLFVVGSVGIRAHLMGIGHLSSGCRR